MGSQLNMNKEAKKSYFSFLFPTTGHHPTSKRCSDVVLFTRDALLDLKVYEN